MIRPTSTMKVNYEPRIKQNIIGRQTISGIPYQSNVVDDFIQMRQKVQSVQRQNIQFLKNFRQNELSRSKKSATNKSRSKIRIANEDNTKLINFEMEIERLKNKISQDKRSKELLQEQLSLVQSRCERQKNKYQKIEQTYQSKINNLKMVLTQQMMVFSDNVVRDMFLKIQRKNNRNKQMIDGIYSRLRKEARASKSKSVLRRSLDQPFKRKQVDVDIKQIQQMSDKYQQLFSNKNMQLQMMQQQMKSKDKQIRQLKIAIDKIHSKQKQYKSKSLLEIDQLKQKISILQSNELSLSLLKKDSVQNKTQSKPDGDMGNLKSQLKEKVNNLAESTSRIFQLQKLLIDKSSIIQSLQKDLYNEKLNKNELLSQYQSAVQRNKTQHKAKLQQFVIEIQQLKSTVTHKNATVLQTKQQNSLLKSQIAQLQEQINSLNQKLLLRQQLYLKPIQFIEQSLNVSRNSSLMGPSIEDKELQNLRRQNRLLLLQNQQMKINVNKIDDSKKRLQQQIQLGLLKLQQSQQSNRHLKTQMMQLQKDLITATKQQNLIAQPQGKTNQQLEIQIKILQSNNQTLQKQNVHINSELIKYQHDYKLSTDLQSILQSKLLTLKNIIQQNQKRISKQQSEISSLNRIVSLQKQQISQRKFDQILKINNLQDQLNIKTHQIQNLNIKYTELLGFQKEYNINNDIKIKLQLKNQNLEEDIKTINKQLQNQRQQYEFEIKKLKADFEQLTVKNIENQETIKFQSSKINEIEQITQPSEQNNTQHIINMASKIRNLQQVSLELEIVKANLQRQLQESEKLRQYLKQQNNKLILTIENNKSQFNSLIFKAEEKIEQQDKMIRSLEQGIRDREKSGDFSGNKRLHDKSGYSNSFIDLDITLEDNVDLMDKLPYAFQKLHLKRKGHVKMMQKITDLIKNFKTKIENQNKTIVLLNKRIQALKSGDFSTKFTENDIVQIDNEQQLRTFEVTSLKDVNVNRKHTRRIRALEDQRQLILEQNNILQRQVGALQDQLLRADEQQKNYIRMKQIYKQQISRQRKAIQQKSQQVKKLTEQQSLNIGSNVDDASKVFVKIMTIVLTTQRASFAKKNELQQFIKVISCLLQIDTGVSNWMVQQIRR